MSGLISIAITVPSSARLLRIEVLLNNQIRKEGKTFSALTFPYHTCNNIKSVGNPVIQHRIAVCARTSPLQEFIGQM